MYYGFEENAILYINHKPIYIQILEETKHYLVTKIEPRDLIDPDMEYEIKLRKENKNLFFKTKLVIYEIKNNKFIIPINSNKFDLRKKVRQPINKIKVSARVFEKDVPVTQQEHFVCEMLDLSDDGIRLSADANLIEHSFLLITFFLEQDIYENILCEIRHVQRNENKSRYEIGCRFIGFYGAMRDRLAKYIEENYN